GGGGGGGGRIALSYRVKTFTGSTSVSGGAKGGTGAATAGATGSLAEGTRTDAVCASPLCGVGLCAGTYDAGIAACSYAASNGTVCSDGNACTTGETCQEGTCTGGAQNTCNDNNDCTTDACDALLGCRYTNRAGACDDGNACTQNTQCNNGNCGGGIPTSCNDNNACTADSCDPATGCLSTPLLGTGCSDGNACTTADTCTLQGCAGTPLQVPGCYDAFAGPPVIGPAVSDLVSRDGAAVTVDLSLYENDFEDGPAGDGNALTWAIAGVDPALFTATLDPVTDVLVVTPASPTVAFSAALTLYLYDASGLYDTQVVGFTHNVSSWLLATTVTPSPLRTGGQVASVTATLTSPIGLPLANRLVTFERLTGQGYLGALQAVTDAQGQATVAFVSGSAIGLHTVSAAFTDGALSLAASASFEVVGPANDAAVFTLDLTFHDALTGDEVFPGELDLVSPGQPLELRAHIRNLGAVATPALDVRFDDAVVSMSPPEVGPKTALATLATPPIAAGAAADVAFTTSFTTAGLHLFSATIDPADTFEEDDEDNNTATQGFWIGTPPTLPAGVIATTCELETSFLDGSNAAAFAGDTLKLSGRADYAPFLPFDPDHSLGIAAVRGGRVSLTLRDALGQSVTLTQGPTTLFPASGDAPAHRALHTIGLASDLAALGHYPNRSAADTWAFPAPSAEGCYTLVSCVDDGSFQGCCEKVFCVIPRGADLVCSTPALPGPSDAEVAPQVGLPTLLTSTVTNQGDTLASPVFARLVVDGVQVGQAQALGTLGAGQSVTASFAWTPTCSTANVAIEVDHDQLVTERTRANNRCGRATADLELTNLTMQPTDGCHASLALTPTQKGGMPAPSVAGSVSILGPDGATQSASTSGTSLAGPFTFDQPGAYVVSGLIDTPIALPTSCGVAPEPRELDNNTLTFTACADPSPWRAKDGPNNQGAIDLEITPLPFRYDGSVTVTAHITNHGRLPLITPVDVLLSSDQGPVLETDADATDDTKTLASTCADPILPGASKSISWTWTPRYRPDGGPEVRTLLVVVDPTHALATCGADNDTTTRGIGLNLSATLTGDAPQFGATSNVTATIAHSGSLIPHGEGSLARFSMLSRTGLELASSTAPITDPAPGQPELLGFTFAPTAAMCNPTDPATTLRVRADSNDRYLETSEADNTADLTLPNLVPTALDYASDGCTGRFVVTVENAAPKPTTAVGTWYAEVTLTPPAGAPTTTLAGPFVGTGAFEILSGVDARSAGTYAVAVAIDARSTTACGDVPESNEVDNAITRAISLCPDLTPEVAGIDLRTSGTIRWGSPFTLTATVRNVGVGALTTPVTARLATNTGPLATGVDATRVGDFDCDDPLQPGAEREVSWTVTLTEADGLGALLVTLDPADAISGECDESNNTATRGLWMDLSPWEDWHAANFGAVTDIEAAGEPSWGGSIDADYAVYVRAPNPNDPEPPIVVGPSGSEGAINLHTLVRLSGAREALGTAPLGDPAAGDFEAIAFSTTLSSSACDPDDPVQALQVEVDSGQRLPEGREDNNVTQRDFANLVPGTLELSPVTNSRASLDLAVTNPVGKSLGFRPYRIETTVTSPSNATATFATGPFPTVGLRRVASLFDAHENGTYTVTSTLDPPTADALCGTVPEQDEHDNTTTTTFRLCPDLTATLSLGGSLAIGQPTPIEVTVENTGNSTLIEEVEVIVRGYSDLDVELPIALAPSSRIIEASPAAPLDPGQTRSTTFLWTPLTSHARVSRLVVATRVLDTVPDNGAYADAVCGTASATTPVVIAFDKGCTVDLDLATWRACAEASVTANLRRPDSQAPLGASDILSLEATLGPSAGTTWPGTTGPLALTMSGPGSATAELDLPSVASSAPVTVSVTVLTRDGGSCQATATTLVTPGVPDLTVRSETIAFLAKNGDPAPFNRAQVGDLVDVRMSVMNASSACQAQNVVGTASINLGFGAIDLGTWFIGRIEPGASAPILLTPNPLLPNPPTAAPNDAFRWRITAPSPWLDVFTLKITGAAVMDTNLTDNAATRSLMIGTLGASDDVRVSITSPSPGTALFGGVATPTAFRVLDVDANPVEPARLSRLALFAVDDSDAALAEPVDVLTAGTYLGAGLYEATLPVSPAAAGRSLELVVVGTLSDSGLTGSDNATYPVTLGEACWTSLASDTQEGSGPKTLAVRLALPEGLALPTPLSIDVSDTLTGTATSGSDYSAFGTRSLTFPAGAVDGDVATFTVTSIDDGLLEVPETVVLSLTGSELLATCADPHVLSVLDNDALDCPCDDGDSCTVDTCDVLGACTHSRLEATNTPDATCDGRDDDCDGQTDEDFVGSAETCGQAACATAATTRCEDGQIVSGCDPAWQSISDLGDDQCTDLSTERVAYAIVEDRLGKAVGTIRCFQTASGPDTGRIACDLDPDTGTLHVYDGLYCPGP
ncbi:MAG: hypothetical protein JNJ59_03620, partial [Deltaproteobacteria bacterium]|nr:hypothetical protein [Deltaproteobacteria bacterium]